MVTLLQISLLKVDQWGPVPMGGPQQARIPPNSSFQQSPQTQFAMPPNSNGPINPQQQQHGPNQNPQPTVSGRSPIQRQMIIATTQQQQVEKVTQTIQFKNKYNKKSIPESLKEI